MKKVLLSVLFSLMVMCPLAVNAATVSDTKVSISCDKTKLSSNDETECIVYATVPEGVSINGVSTSIGVPSALSLSGKVIAADGWQGEFETGETSVDIYTSENTSGKVKLFSFVLKTGTVSKNDSVTLMINELEVSDSNFDLAKVSGVNTTIELKETTTSGTPGGNTTPGENGTTNNTTGDRENPETGSSLVTVIGGVALLAAGAFVVSQATRKSKFSKIN